MATSSGLITPIVTDVPGRGLQDIGAAVRDLADRARIGKLKLHEFQGGCFTYYIFELFWIFFPYLLYGHVLKDLLTSLNLTLVVFRFLFVIPPYCKC